MAPQTVTHAIEADAEPIKFFHLLAEVKNIPRWAPVFADSIEHISESRYRVRKNSEAFEMESCYKCLCLHRRLHPGDDERQTGRRIHSRHPRPLGGSSITMTVPIAANTSEEIGRAHV